MKVLIIDDDIDVRRIACLGLSKVGKMDVIDVDNGKEGLTKAKTEQPDVILLDVMMPSMDGPATLEALQSEEETKHIPVIFLTAKAMTSEVERLKKLGAVGVMTKPFDPIKLSEEILEVLKKQA